MLNLTHLARTINSLIGGKIFSKQNKMADLLFPLTDPQIRERKFQQREIYLDELTDEEFLGNLLPNLTFFLFVILFVSFDWITSICFFTLSVIMETSSGEKFGFLFPWLHFPPFCFLHRPRNPRQFFAPYFFRGRRSKNSLNRFSFSTNLGLVNRGIISLSGTPF